ncbi:hypothetical protein CLOM_g14248 [Closterium sp. NIES-68]|nr:hypothetical protein CLOM_g14248 [Closterium sp. NIES-68]
MARSFPRAAVTLLLVALAAQGIAQPPSSPPAILASNPCTIPSLSSALLRATADVGANAVASTGLDSTRASLGGSPSLNAVPAGFVSDVAGAVSGVGRAAGSVAGSAGKAAGSAAGLVDSVAGSAVGTAGKAAGSVGSLAGSAAGLVGSTAGSAVGTAGKVAGSAGNVAGAWVAAAANVNTGANAGATATARVLSLVGETRLSAALASSLLARISSSTPLPLFLRLNAQQVLVTALLQ